MLTHAAFSRCMLSANIATVLLYTYALYRLPSPPNLNTVYCPDLFVIVVVKSSFNIRSTLFET